MGRSARARSTRFSARSTRRTAFSYFRLGGGASSFGAGAGVLPALGGGVSPNCSRLRSEETGAAEWAANFAACRFLYAVRSSGTAASSGALGSGWGLSRWQGVRFALRRGGRFHLLTVHRLGGIRGKPPCLLFFHFGSGISGFCTL